MAVGDANNTDGAAIVSRGVTITGNVECAGEIQINGHVDGEVRAPAVFVETSGRVNGGVVSDRLRVAGVVEGSIEVGDLAVEATGQISGEVSYARIKIVAGGRIGGQFTPSSAASEPSEASPVKLVNAPSGDNPRRVYVD